MSKMVRKATTFEIINHWIMAVIFILLSITGFGFLFHLEELNSVFGNFNNMRVIHNWGGLVFLASLLLSLFSYFKEAAIFTPEDIGWLKGFGGYLSRKAETPPQGRMNAGQKLYYLVLLFFGAAISASGIMIWLSGGLRSLIMISHFIHNISFDFFMIAVPLHIYLGTFANPGTFRIMVYGTVPLEWARKRHAKWVQKMGF